MKTLMVQLRRGEQRLNIALIATINDSGDAPIEIMGVPFVLRAGDALVMVDPSPPQGGSFLRELGIAPMEP